jgi:hypothetical protein
VRAVLIGFTTALSLWAQDDFHVYRDPPRLFLTAQRQRLLERERERDSVRWQFLTQPVSDTKPVLIEPGFVWSLYYRISHQNPAGRKAADWALSPGHRPAPASLVYDWCAL